MKILTALSLALASWCACAEEVYREVGEDGVPVFSDQAMPGAEPITIREPVIFKDTAIQRNQQERNSTPKEESSAPDYNLMIADPPDNAAIRDNAGNLTLTIAISPTLQAGHRAELLMNGQKLRNVDMSGPVDLTNLDRGTHVFSLRVVDRQDLVITSGPGTSISVLRFHK